MYFNEFAQHLHPIIGNNESKPHFVRTLFEAIVSSERGQQIIENYSDQSFKNYYYGTQNIYAFAKKIHRYIDSSAFYEYLNDFQQNEDDAVMANLCRTFEDIFPDITQFNVTDKLGELFASIITEAATYQKNPHTSTAKAADSLLYKPFTNALPNRKYNYYCLLVAPSNYKYHEKTPYQLAFKFITNHMESGLVWKVSDELKWTYGLYLTEEAYISAAVNIMKIIPTIFATKNDAGGSSANQNAYFCSVNNIVITSSSIKISFETLATIPQKLLNSDFLSFGLHDGDLDCVQWNIRQANIIRALEKFGYSALK